MLGKLEHHQIMTDWANRLGGIYRMRLAWVHVRLSATKRIFRTVYADWKLQAVMKMCNLSTNWVSVVKLVISQSFHPKDGCLQYAETSDLLKILQQAPDPRHCLPNC